MNRILVGVDFSPSSWSALKYASKLALRLDAEIILCHSWNPASWAVQLDEGGVGGQWLEDARRAAESKLESWKAELEAGGVRCGARFEIGAASGRLVDLAGELRPLLLVVGRRGTARLAHVLLGSVTERVVNHSPSPVLVVPADTDIEQLPQRLLVGIDFSPASRVALDTACAWVRRLGGNPSILATHCQPGDQDRFLESWSEIAHEERWPYDLETLERWAAKSAQPEVRVELSLTTGRAEVVLSELAESAGFDWIVVGLQGRTALASFLIGSTTNRVLRLSHCPVLVVPTDETEAGELAS